MSLLNIIKQGKLKYCEHILRTDNGMEKVIKQGKVEGKRRGRSRRAKLNHGETGAQP